MSADLKLGTLKKVELRDYWEKEDTHFTPWLAGQENLKFLGDTIGMELELIEAETHVGPFRADILCREINTDAYVLIENQLEQTDHLHLGQLMTYAAGLDAVHIIWVARTFNDEHRAALDWLNRITVEGFHFFGIEVELWQIGDSLPAPKFNIVSKPNDWTKAVRKGKEKYSAERTIMYMGLWSQFIRYLNSKFPDIDCPKPTGMPWIKFMLRDSNAVISYAPSTKKLSLYLTFEGDNPGTWFDHVKRNSESFEKEVGHPFEWISKEDGSGYVQWFADFDHESKDTMIDTFELVGSLINDLSQAINASYNKFKQR